MNRAPDHRQVPTDAQLPLVLVEVGKHHDLALDLSPGRDLGRGQLPLELLLNAGPGKNVEKLFSMQCSGTDFLLLIYLSA